ncbi:MAG TPA: hypothetical protein PLU75_04345 [Oscillospiraceae bacterium]|nr:hypothetical protein [Oscillospiraceae bacterium]HRW56682.1 hypothetical protein [Oscillospiraceae bacterium]
MKRAAVLLLVLFLGGCSAGMPAVKDVQAYYAQPFSAEITFALEESTAACAFSRDGEIFLLTAESPDSVAGLETELCGETAVLRYAGMERTFPVSALPEANPAVLLRGMILALAAGNFTLTGTEEGTAAEGEGFLLYFDADSLAPEKAVFSDVGLTVHFGPFDAG